MPAVACGTNTCRSPLPRPSTQLLHCRVRSTTTSCFPVAISSSSVCTDRVCPNGLVHEVHLAGSADVASQRPRKLPRMTGWRRCGAAAPAQATHADLCSVRSGSERLRSREPQLGRARYTPPSALDVTRRSTVGPNRARKWTLASHRGQPPACYKTCTVFPATPNRAATSVTVSPSARTARTASYLCSATLNSRNTSGSLRLDLQRDDDSNQEVSRINRDGVNHQARHRQASGEQEMSPLNRDRTSNEWAARCPVSRLS